MFILGKLKSNDLFISWSTFYCRCISLRPYSPCFTTFRWDGAVFHLCSTSALLQANGKDYVRGHGKFAHRWAARLHNEWNMQTGWSHCSLHYIPYQTETSIAETGKEKKEQVNKRARGLRRWTPELNEWILQNRCRSGEERLFGNDETGPEGLPLHNLRLNYSLKITCWYYLIIVLNEP